MNTIEFVADKEWQVLSHFGFEHTGLKHVDCPICGGKKKFRLNEYNGSAMYICTCGSGGLFKLLQETTGRDFKSLADEIDRVFGNNQNPNEYEKPKVNERLINCVNRFRSIEKLEGTQGEEYLNNRGITQLPVGGVKYSPKELHTDVDRYFGCMYAIASNEYGEAIQRHLTYLDGNKKVDLDRDRKMLSLQEYSGSIAVKLFPVKSTLGIAEGIETALSAHQLYKLPVWSALNATLLKKFKAPAGVNTLVIYADNDKNGTGLNAAFECGNKNLLSNNDVVKVLIRWPELPDFNDMLLEGCKIFEWTLTK